MKDFERLKNECIYEVADAGICTGTVKSWMINNRARTRWGYCKKENDGTFTIQIARQLLTDDRISEKSCKETIIHELLHTCYGCMNHQKKWKFYAGLMNQKYGYSIKRVSTGTEKGIEDYKPTRQMPVKYVFRCGGCGVKIYRKRDSKFTRNYRNYRCARCGAADWHREKMEYDL